MSQVGRCFERMLDGLVGGDISWVDIVGDSRKILEDSGKVAGLCDVKLEQIMDASCHVDILDSGRISVW